MQIQNKNRHDTDKNIKSKNVNKITFITADITQRVKNQVLHQLPSSLLQQFGNIQKKSQTEGVQSYSSSNENFMTMTTTKKLTNTGTTTTSTDPSTVTAAVAAAAAASTSTAQQTTTNAISIKSKTKNMTTNLSDDDSNNHHHHHHSEIKLTQTNSNNVKNNIKWKNNNLNNCDTSVYCNNSNYNNHFNKINNHNNSNVSNNSRDIINNNNKNVKISEKNHLIDKKCDKSRVQSVNKSNSLNDSNSDKYSANELKNMTGASTNVTESIKTTSATTTTSDTLSTSQQPPSIITESNTTTIPYDDCDDDSLIKQISLLPDIDDDGDDPYYELQEYLERVKREINEVFEQYKLKNDESPTCTNVNSNTSNNKLLEHETPCFLNDTTNISEKKFVEISNSRTNNCNRSNDEESERSSSSWSSSNKTTTPSAIVASVIAAKPTTITMNKTTNTINSSMVTTDHDDPNNHDVNYAHVVDDANVVNANSNANSFSASSIQNPKIIPTVTTNNDDISTTSTTPITLSSSSLSSSKTRSSTKLTKSLPVTITRNNNNKNHNNNSSSSNSSNKYCNKKKHAQKLQPEDNQLRSQQLCLQNENIANENSKESNRNAVVTINTNHDDDDDDDAVTDDVDAGTSASSSSSVATRMNLDNTMAMVVNAKDTNNVKMWTNTILKDLDNLMGSDKRFNVRSMEKDRNVNSMNISTNNNNTKNNENQNWTPSNILKPEKHATIPLQSFSLDHPLKESLNHVSGDFTKKDNNPISIRKSLIFLSNTMNTTNNNNISCKDQICDKNHHKQHNDNVTILKIEEESNNKRSSVLAEKNQQKHEEKGKSSIIEEARALSEYEKLQAENQQIITTTLTLATDSNGCNSIGIVPLQQQTAKKEILQQASFCQPITLTTTNSNSHHHHHQQQQQNDTIKKGSTSTIWTSEESILRSVGAVDEDNKSTSSSACDEAASAFLSSVKSDNSSVSSENDNENNESGIGTATPPKDIDSGRINLIAFKNNNNLIISKDIIDNTNDINNSTNSYYSMSDKFTKFNNNNNNNNSIASSDDPDLLEVLSQLENGCNVDDDDDDDDVRNYELELSADNEIGNETSNYSENDVIMRNKTDCERTPVQRYKMTILLDRNCGKKLRSQSIEPLPVSSQNGGYELYHDTFHHHHNSHNHQHHHHQQHDKDQRKRHHLFCLPLNQEPFQNHVSCNIRELPSPSSASLHSGNGALVMQELTMKSNSAPILLKKEKHKDGFGGHQNSLRYSRSQSDRYLAEIEAIEACKWLRAAGFPQYAQMYEDLQFPIDLSNVAKDHPMLESDPLQSLYRRLCTLNRCATMRLDNTHKQHDKQKEESDDEGFTLSENWTFQPQSRRWSRVGEAGLDLPVKRCSQQLLQPPQLQQQQQQQNQDKSGDGSSKDSSPERFDADSVNDETEDHSFTSFVLRSDTPQPEIHADANTVRLRRTGSERLKDSAKALLRRVESIKSRRRKRQNREGLVISGPQMLNLPHIKGTDITAYSNPPSPSPTSPVKIFPRQPIFGNELKVPTEHDRNVFNPNLLSPKRSIAKSPKSPHSSHTSPSHFFTPTMPHLHEGKSDDSSSYYSDSQESTSGSRTIRRLPSRSRRLFQRSGKVDDIGAHSDSECHQGRKMILKDASTHTSEVKVKKLTRGGSLNFGKESKRYREAFQSRSFRARSGTRKSQKGSESDREDGKVKSHVVRWHSFRSDENPQIIFKKCFTVKETEQTKIEGTPFSSMSCGQLQIIRKLALVTLTGYMERYCPTHRSGWNWELPKFIKKIKTPDYKDKKVFGVPLLLILQRTGHSLPIPIRGALKWLHINALDQIGLFRKSGVKSRITKLKERVELSEMDDCLEIYDTQQAFDVADMLKQYFRDLPDCLLTAKMSETFVAIFQHLPAEVRSDALQSAVLLLPDENREVLYSLLKFLNEVANNSEFNQMTANNLAVCLAPSLFHSNISNGNRSTSASPRRRKITGVPDAKELSETKASHECLAFMILNYQQIFTASRDKILRCNFGYMEESKPVPLEALGEGLPPFHNWRGYLYECISATIKEGRERTRGWISVTPIDPNVEIAYKKVGDGHPLRLWRCTTDIDASPNEVLNYILKERNLWDTDVLKCRTVQKLDERSEVFQYARDGQIITDYCVLRSWQPDLPRKGCVVVETSIEHPDAPLLFGGIRGVVLASRYLIEPIGGGKSRLMHLARIDTKGRTPEWYNKSYGHICSHYLTNIRSAFRQINESSDNKV